MVTEASNYGAREAKAIGLVEVVSPALLNEVDGMKTVPKDSSWRPPAPRSRTSR